MGLSHALSQRVRARPEEDDETENIGESDSSVGFDEEEDMILDESDVSEETANDDESTSEDESAEDIRSSINEVSFGALTKAQDSLGKRKRQGHRGSEGGDSSKGAETLEEIRERIHSAKEKEGHPKKEKQKIPTRSSKNAPTVQSSKHAVTRKRTVVEAPPSAKPRDPRFDSVVIKNSSPRDPAAMGNAAALARQRYSFLDQYRADELATIRKQMMATKNPDEREALKKLLTSKTDRQRTFEQRDRERGIRAEHRKRERQLLREGKKKTPYFLKRSDIAREAQIQRYQEMGGKARQKALEKRRKKVASKERKEMPLTRRTGGADVS